MTAPGKLNRGLMKKLLILAAAVLAAYLGLHLSPLPRHGSPTHSVSRPDDSALANAYARHASGIQVTGNGVVARVLPDDTEGSRHQRFIVRLPSGQTLLVAHNIDLAPRVALRAGDRIEFKGEYEWNAQGGVLHWTHHDPHGSHVGGWLKHDGHTYQ